MKAEEEERLETIAACRDWYLHGIRVCADALEQGKSSPVYAEVEQLTERQAKEVLWVAIMMGGTDLQMARDAEQSDPSRDHSVQTRLKELPN